MDVQTQGLLGAALSADTVLYQDIVRFSDFSNGFDAIHTDRSDTLADIRYSNQPVGIDPLWGIEMDRAHPQQHVRYAFYRDLSKQKRQLFWAMLRNKDIE